MISISRQNSNAIRSSNSKMKSAKKVRIHVQNKFVQNKNKIKNKSVQNLALSMNHQSHPPNLKIDIYKKALHNLFQHILYMKYLLL